jgi:hypothetical protein
MIQQFRTHAYIMISSVGFSNCALCALLKQQRSFQVTFPSTQTVRCACPRSVYAPRTLRVCRVFRAFIPKHCIDTKAARILWRHQPQTP